MAVYGFLNEGLIKNIKDSRAAAAQKKEDKARVKEREEQYKKLIPKITAATKKVTAKYAKDSAIQKKIPGLIKSYIKRINEDPKHELDDNDMKNLQYNMDHPEDVEFACTGVDYDRDDVEIGVIAEDYATGRALYSIICSIGKDIAKELGDIGTPYTITGPNLDEDEYDVCHFKFKGSQNESAINEGLNLFGKNKKDNKSQTRMYQKPNPLSPEQKADAKKIIVEIKKISPSVIANANKNRNYMGWLNDAADLVDYDEYTKGKKLTRKWDCWFGDTSDDEIIVYCMDKSIIDADNAALDIDGGDYHFSKYTRDIVGNLSDEIINKLTDTYGLDVIADPDSIDGAIWFMIRNRK